MSVEAGHRAAAPGDRAAALWNKDTLRWMLSWLDVSRELPRIHLVCKEWRDAAMWREENATSLTLHAMRNAPTWLGTNHARRWAKHAHNLTMRLPPFFGCSWSQADVERLRDWVHSMPQLQSLVVQHMTSRQGTTAFCVNTWQLATQLTSVALIDTPVPGPWLAGQQALTHLSMTVDLQTWQIARLPAGTILPHLRRLEWTCIIPPSRESALSMMRLIGTAPWHRFPRLQHLDMLWETPFADACRIVCNWWERPDSTLQSVKAGDCDSHRNVTMQRQPATLVVKDSSRAWHSIASWRTKWTESVTLTDGIHADDLARLQCGGRLVLKGTTWQGAKQTLSHLNVESVTHVDLETKWQNDPMEPAWLCQRPWHGLCYMSLDLTLEDLHVMLAQLASTITLEARILYIRIGPQTRPLASIDNWQSPMGHALASLFAKHANLLSVTGVCRSNPSRETYGDPIVRLDRTTTALCFSESLGAQDH